MFPPLWNIFVLQTTSWSGKEGSVGRSSIILIPIKFWPLLARGEWADPLGLKCVASETQWKALVSLVETKLEKSKSTSRLRKNQFSFKIASNTVLGKCQCCKIGYFLASNQELLLFLGKFCMAFGFHREDIYPYSINSSLAEKQSRCLSAGGRDLPKRIPPLSRTFMPQNESSFRKWCRWREGSVLRWRLRMVHWWYDRPDEN